MSLLLQGSSCSAPPTSYGVGNSLQGRTPPSVVSPGDASAIPPGILDAGCNTAACTVSWTSDIFPKMESTGPWKCAATSCHGGATLPTVHDGDPVGAYASFATFSGTFTAPYVVPCNTDPAASSIECNLEPNGCGTPMPIGVGSPLTSDELAAIESWIQCGSPLN